MANRKYSLAELIAYATGSTVEGERTALKKHLAENELDRLTVESLKVYIEQFGADEAQLRQHFQGMDVPDLNTLKKAKPTVPFSPVRGG